MYMCSVVVNAEFVNEAWVRVLSKSETFEGLDRQKKSVWEKIMTALWNWQLYLRSIQKISMWRNMKPSNQRIWKTGRCRNEKLLGVVALGIGPLSDSNEDNDEEIEPNKYKLEDVADEPNVDNNGGKGDEPDESMY
ncbi:hypothetical protein QAD02_001325 [Eretmocerus hayati]|uniref:Uncharacterized protein n=1 Tax=Eretmocerus hayati TaxID=131215 RepID=A0ACC2NGM1_9HYME|nr:hypothetical protein QAD02_001325 [Eretmocerus hayati]